MSATADQVLSRAKQEPSAFMVLGSCFVGPEEDLKRRAVREGAQRRKRLLPTSADRTGRKSGQGWPRQRARRPGIPSHDGKGWKASPLSGSISGIPKGTRAFVT
jgi:hypothetical protein